MELLAACIPLDGTCADVDESMVGCELSCVPPDDAPEAPDEVLAPSWEEPPEDAAPSDVTTTAPELPPVEDRFTADVEDVPLDELRAAVIALEDVEPTPAPPSSEMGTHCSSEHW